MAEAHVTQAPPKPANFGLGNTAPSNAKPADAEQTTQANVTSFFAQWINSTGIPEFNTTYTVYRTKSGFRIDGRVKQNLDFFRMPVEIEVQTEGNPEIKTIEVAGTDSSFTTEDCGRPRPGGIILEPHSGVPKSLSQFLVPVLIGDGQSLPDQ